MNSEHEQELDHECKFCREPIDGNAVEITRHPLFIICPTCGAEYQVDYRGAHRELWAIV